MYRTLNAQNVLQSQHRHIDLQSAHILHLTSAASSTVPSFYFASVKPALVLSCQHEPPEPSLSGYNVDTVTNACFRKASKDAHFPMTLSGLMCLGLRNCTKSASERVHTSACTTDVKQWYMQNGLQLNPDKSEALFMGTATQLTAVSSLTSVTTSRECRGAGGRFNESSRCHSRSSPDFR